MAASSLTLLSPNAYSSGTCGYCSPSGSRSAQASSKKYGMVVSQMSVVFYQGLIDRGWRRSGTYTYHPDMANTCCPQYTIRLDAKAFRPSKKHRQVMNRWNKFIATGHRPGEGEAKESKGKGKATESSWLTNLLQHESHGEPTSGQAKHRYEVELAPATATQETFALYKRYQVAVHKDKPGDVSMKGFERFLCKSPLQARPIDYRHPINRLPKTYGSYHLLYRVNGHLIGISVIDILPACVSSVYFIWDPDWAWASLGKLSALREVALALEMAEAGAEGMQWVYMGYWIADCQKMRYKSEYSPSYLLDPGTHVFHPLSDALHRFLSSHPRGYIPFDDIPKEADWTTVIQDTGRPKADSAPEDEPMDEFDEPDDWPIPPPPGYTDPTAFTTQQIDNLICRVGAGPRGPLLARLGNVPFIDSSMVKELVRELAAAVGIEHLLSAGEAPQSLESKAVVNFG